MTPTTYRPRAAGPGFSSRDIRAKYLALSGGVLELAFWMACQDVAELSTGGMYRLQRPKGEVEVNVDSPGKAL